MSNARGTVPLNRDLAPLLFSVGFRRLNHFGTRKSPRPLKDAVLQRLRCNACGQVFTAQEPEGVEPDKYYESAAAMIAQLKYGSGVPFNRLERMEELMGILPAATQWEVVAEAAQVIKPAR